MRMLKTGLLNFISVLVKVITGLFLNKIMALYVGPAGYALVSQFQNGINFITTFASGAINTGVTKYTAEYANDKGKTSDLFKCITLLAITCCSFFSLTIIVFSEYFSLKLLGTINYSGVIKWFAATLFLFVANSILVSIINGLKEFKLYVLINIFGSLFSLLFSGILIYFFNLKGALIAFATNQSIVFFMTFYLIISKKMVSLKSFIGMPSDFYFIKKLIQYALMAIVSAFCVIYMQIIIRTYIANHFGWVQAGIWDGVWRISSLYLMLVTVPLGVYYLPRLAELHTKSLLLREIKQGYLFLLPIIIISAIIIYYLRYFIIELLFSKSFVSMGDIIGWQLLGDIFKIGSWLLSYIMLSKALTKTYIITEITTALLFLGGVHYLSPLYGLKGVTLAYCITYFCYWIMMIVVIISYFKGNFRNE